MNPLPLTVPLGAVYAGGVQLGAYALERLDPAARERLLRACSTNADNLDAGRWDTLAPSALPRGPVRTAARVGLSGGV